MKIFAPPTLNDIMSALAYIDNGVDRDTWVKIGMALKSELGDAGFDVWDAWSQGHPSYNQRHNRSVWKGFKNSGAVTIAFLFKLARAGGYRPDPQEISAEDKARFAAEQAERKAQQKLQAEREAQDEQKRHGLVSLAAQNIWQHVAKPLGESEYLKAKEVGAFGVKFLHHKLVIVTQFNPFRVNYYLGSKAYQAIKAARVERDAQRANGLKDEVTSLHFYGPGTLVVPVYYGGQLVNLQFIRPNGKKQFLKAGKKQEAYFFTGGVKDSAPILLGEGYATMATLHQITGWPVFVAWDAGNLLPVAVQIREKFPNHKIIVCGDDDENNKTNTGRIKAQNAAECIGGFAIFPSLIKLRAAHGLE